MWVKLPSGNQLDSAASPNLVIATVCSSERVIVKGLYAPYTLGGTIIVNGVVASSHSRWIADNAFDALGLPAAWLPRIYQALMAPARLLFWAMGSDAYVEMYEKVDTMLDITSTMTSAGPLVLLARLAGLFAVAYGYAAYNAWLLFVNAVVSPVGAAVVAVAAASAGVAATKRPFQLLN
jgi:hypothetical protein